MMLYILKSGVCLAALYLFYKLFLERENMHLFKRWYLLLSILLAFVIPLITFTYTIPEVTPAESTIQEVPLAFNTDQIQEQTHYLVPVLWSIYGLGAFVFGILFIKNLIKMLFKIKQNIKIKTTRFTNVLLKDSILPHTFFTYIFLNKYKFETQQIPKEVLLHEEAHARQKHSLDILFIEAIQVLFWFNPLVYLLKRAIKLNHEFLADRSVITHGAKPSAYQHLLLAFSSNAKHHQLANAINYSLIKKRFTVMTKQTSKRAIGLRSLLLLPLLAVLLYGFSSKIAVPEENNISTNIKEELQYADPMQRVATDPEKEIVVEDVTVFVRRDGTLRINNQSATLKNLKSKLDRMNKDLSFEERRRWVRAVIYADPATKMKLITSVKNILRAYGISKISLGTIPPPPPPVPDTDAPGHIEAEEAPETLEIIEHRRKAEAEAMSQKEKAVLVEELARFEAEKAIEIKAERAALVKELAEIEAEEAVEAMEVIEIEEAAKAIEIVEIPEVIEIPPPPPPVSPTKHVINMAKKGAIFYYEGKRISPDKAIQIVKSKKHINISTKRSNSKQPVVHLSGKPIVIEN